LGVANSLFEKAYSMDFRDKIKINGIFEIHKILGAKIPFIIWNK